MSEELPTQLLIKIMPFTIVKASVCRRAQFRARSSVEGYRRLPANDQVQLLQYVSIAPVAVGICGTDKSFMFCKLSSTCCVCSGMPLFR